MSNAGFWRGVLPAITTPFTASGAVDHAFLAEHAKRMLAAGCSGIVPLGSLGESATLSFEEKIAIVRTLVAAVEGRVPVVAGIAALSTDDGMAVPWLHRPENQAWPRLSTSRPTLPTASSRRATTVGLSFSGSTRGVAPLAI